MRIYLTCVTLLFACILHAQVPGSVHDPASPVINPLDPNGDGFITSTGAAFTGPSDETQFELPFIAVRQCSAEPGAENKYDNAIPDDDDKAWSPYFCMIKASDRAHNRRPFRETMT
jgi:hypothetical protein